MASTLDYLEYVLDLLSDIENITYKKMMGEYILYCDGIIFGGIYDNRFLIKKTKTLENMGFKEEIPYCKAFSLGKSSSFTVILLLTQIFDRLA